jgi:hypothetical protein
VPQISPGSHHTYVVCWRPWCFVFCRSMGRFCCNKAASSSQLEGAVTSGPRQTISGQIVWRVSPFVGWTLREHLSTMEVCLIWVWLSDFRICETCCLDALSSAEVVTGATGRSASQGCVSGATVGEMQEASRAVHPQLQCMAAVGIRLAREGRQATAVPAGAP